MWSNTMWASHDPSLSEDCMEFYLAPAKVFPALMYRTEEGVDFVCLFLHICLERQWMNGGYVGYCWGVPRLISRT